jgi:hypothetical protein
MKQLQEFLRHLLAALREIFDENAYQRFLLRTGGAVSVESYRAFMREREVGMAKRPRCC